MKTSFIIPFLIIQSFCLPGQSVSHLESDTSVNEFGKMFFQSIIRKDAGVLLPLLYKKADLMETVKRQVRNEDLRDEMLSDIDTPGFDEQIVEESRVRHGVLIGHPEIDWEKIRYKDFKFVRDNLQTMKYQIECGQGFL